MSKERELLARVLESRTFMQGVALRREIEQLLAQPEQTEQFPLPGERLIEMWRDGYDAGVRLAQPEHIPDVGNMVTQEPVYWENEKKALLNEIDHLTNRLAQPELSTDSLQLDEQDLREDLRECLRDRFAGLAMQRLLVGYSAPAYKDAAKLSYQMADAMLIAREAGL